MSLILASGSVRRAQLLEQCGIRFTVDVADVDESLDPKLIQKHLFRHWLYARHESFCQASGRSGAGCGYGGRH